MCARASRGQAAHLQGTDRQGGRNDAFLIRFAGSVARSRNLRFRTALRLSRIGDLLFRQHPVQVGFRYLEHLAQRALESRVLVCRLGVRLHSPIINPSAKQGETIMSDRDILLVMTICQLLDKSAAPRAVESAYDRAPRQLDKWRQRQDGSIPPNRN